VHHGLLLLLASKMVTDQLQLLKAGDLPGVPEVLKALQMRCTMETARLYEGQAEEVKEGAIKEGIQWRGTGPDVRGRFLIDLVLVRE
jgi:hypothetical protein